MKYLLHSLGINVTELAYLLLISEYTLHSWFKRGSMIPPPHNLYLSALEVYQRQKKAEDLVQLGNRWESENEALLKSEQATALKALYHQLQQCKFNWEKLKQKESKMLNRWHLSEKYPQYLAPELRDSEQVQDWCRLIGRKSKLLLGDARQAIWKLEQKIAGLEAEVAFWEGKIKQTSPVCLPMILKVSTFLST